MSTLFQIWSVWKRETSRTKSRKKDNLLAYLVFFWVDLIFVHFAFTQLSIHPASINTNPSIHTIQTAKWSNPRFLISPSIFSPFFPVKEKGAVVAEAESLQFKSWSSAGWRRTYAGTWVKVSSLSLRTDTCCYFLPSSSESVLFYTFHIQTNFAHLYNVSQPEACFGS